VKRSPLNDKFNRRSVDTALRGFAGRQGSVYERTKSPRPARDMWKPPDEIEEDAEEEGPAPHKFKVITKEDVEIFETDLGSDEEETGKVEKE